uniref:Uncharacterized protein n=1 Tax=Octactis speculum TaxID=3111310 RepID=A0A7S2DF57_9STRA|mmetsp:Transcript_47072/g.64091  ORF Transcript_47072/g.64091 Transcript_47072/m.64091 type:complete len:181 (+) Transcript_47072:30-572(+)
MEEGKVIKVGPGAGRFPMPLNRSATASGTPVSMSLNNGPENNNGPGVQRANSACKPPVLVRRETSSSNSRVPVQYDWHLFLTIEERQAVRQKIKQAYQGSCPNYQDLLETVVAIEEELLHISAPSRLDYFKSGIQFDKRVSEKRNQLAGQLALVSTDETESDEPQSKKMKLETPATTRHA